MPYFTTSDNTEIYYKDWGNKNGQPVVFSHGWPLDSDNWENQMFFLGNLGYRVIAHDRRGHGRSSQPWSGNDIETYACDLHALFKHLSLKNAMLVGHSTGGAEVVRFLGKYEHENLVSRAVLVSAVTPVLVQKEGHSNGVPIEVFDGFRKSMREDRAQFFLDVASGPFFGFNRKEIPTSQGLIQSWWQQGMMCGFKNAYDCIAAFSETDLTEDMKKIQIPVLILHGDDDQIVPIDGSTKESIKLLKNGELRIYPGGPHALPNIRAQQVNEDLLDFLKAGEQA